MRGKVVVLWLCAAALAFAAATATEAQEEKEKRPLVQVALLLDTSNSMDGLINQAKTQLWKFVNEFATAKKDGKAPEIYVALYEYGNDRLSKESKWIRRVLPLTDDLDMVSKELFALRTNGGSEYCGAVIKHAVENLDWSKSDGDLKVIFIAGNEPFTQGGVDYRKACKAAIEKGITVNTIFCGNHAEGVRTHWKDGATLADGMYMHIDQSKVVHIDAPQDKELARLGRELNRTYVGYGAAGKLRKEEQKMQDENAAKAAPGVMAQRAITKAQKDLYRNAGWDLVDAVAEGKARIEDLKDEDLPEEMRKMTVEERKAYVEKKRKERAELQKKINDLNEQRKKYVAQKMKELSGKGEDTLDSAMIKAIREQAKKKQFRFEESAEK